MITIVFPYLHSYAVWNELIFTLRSIEKNLLFDYRVIIFGDVNPKIKNVTYVEMQNISGGEFSKAKDSIKKMNAMISHPEVTEDFLYWYDDIILLKQIDLSFFDNLYAVNDIAKIRRIETNNYMRNMFNTHDALLKKGYSTINYETHLPRLFNKQKMKETLDTFCPNMAPILINTCYYNMHGMDPVFLHKEDKVKAGFYGLSSATSFENKVDLNQVLSEKVFLSYNNKGLTQNMRKYIISKFNKKSQYET